MPTMQEVLADQAKRKNLIQDCALLIDEEVKRKGGLGGMAIKTGYKVVKGFKPGFIERTIDSLIDDFADRLQPIAAEAQEKGKAVADHFVAERSRVADTLLGITDQRAERSSHKTIKNAYTKLRPTAKKHVEEAVPGVGRLIEKYTGG